MMKRSGPVVLLAAVLGIGAFWGVLALTDPPGPGLDPDSMAYLGAGMTFVRDGAFRVPLPPWTSADTTAPLAHFPPGFSTSIATGIRSGMDPVNAARLVEALAAGVAVAAVVLAASTAAGMAAALTAVAMLAATPAFVTVHSAVLSEPLFLALLALFTWRLASDEKRTARTANRALVLGALAAAATLVRYAGASLVAAAALDAFLATRGDGWRARVRRVATAGALPVLAIGAWSLTRRMAASEVAIRSPGVYTRGLGRTLGGGAATVGAWLAPGFEMTETRAAVAIVMLVALVTLLTRAVRAARAERAARVEREKALARDRTAEYRAPEAMSGDRLAERELRLYRATAIVGGCYMLVIGASRLFADPGIPLDDRLLAPIFLLASLGAAPALTSWMRAASRGPAFVSGVVFIAWLAGSAKTTADLVRDYRSDGGDFASSEWRISPLVDWVAHHGAGVPLYSNWPAAIWFHTARAARELPPNLAPKTVDAFRAKFEREHGALISFAEESPDWVRPDSLARRAGLVPAGRWAGGTVWRMPADVCGGPCPEPPPPAGAATPVPARIRP